MGDREVWSWVAKARPYEVLSTALLLERGALRRYSELAEKTKDRLSRAKFRYLAEEEREHARVLGAAMQGMKRPKSALPKPAFSSEVRGAPDGDTAVEAARLALRAEKDSEKFYGRCAERCRKPAARHLFEWLRDQETRHARTLEDELTLLSGAFAWRSLEGAPPAEEDFWA